MDFVNENQGYVIAKSYGDALILKTIDGGNSWINQIDIQEYLNLNSVDFLTPDYGIVVGNDGKILKTVDGGTNWNLYTLPYDYRLNDMEIVDLNTVYIAADDGNIIKTTDGGVSWEYLNTGIDDDLFAIEVYDNYNLYAVGIAGTILKTNNGGSNWVKIESNTTHPIYSVCIVDSATCLAAGHFGTILRTTNATMSTGLYIPESPMCSKLNVFPNPTNGKITVQSQELGRIEVIEIQGMIIYKSTMSCNSCDITIGDYSEGVYFLKVITNYGVSVKKIIIE